MNDILKTDTMLRRSIALPVMTRALLLIDACEMDTTRNENQEVVLRYDSPAGE